MKTKQLKLLIILFLGFGLVALHGQTIMTVKTGENIKNTYKLSNIRKLTFPSTGTMSILKFADSTDSYALSDIKYLKFGNDVSNNVNEIYLYGNLRIFPNPVDDLLHLRLTATKNEFFTIELLSIEGKELYKTQISGSVDNYQINVSQLSSGMYLCRVNDGIRIETIKFVKQ